MALAAVVNEGRTALAPWAGEALPRLPEIARVQPSAWYLEQEAHAELPPLRALGTAPPDEVDQGLLARLARPARRAALGVLRVGDRVYLGAVGPSGQSIAVPATDPRIVEVIEPARERTVQIPAAAGIRLPSAGSAIAPHLAREPVRPVGVGRPRPRAPRVVGGGAVLPRRGAAGTGVVVGDDLVIAETSDVASPADIGLLFRGGRLATEVLRRREGLTLFRVAPYLFEGRLPVRRLRRAPNVTGGGTAGRISRG